MANDASFEVRRRLANNEHTACQDFSIIIIAKLTPRRLASKNSSCDKSNLEKLAHRGNSCHRFCSQRQSVLTFEILKEPFTRSCYPFGILNNPFSC